MSTRSALQRIGTLLWLTVAIALVVLALTVSLGRYYLRNVGEYQEVLLAELHRRTGLAISAESLAGDWRRLVPELKASHLVLTHPDTGEPVLSAAGLTVRLDLVRSLWTGAPRFHQLAAHGVDIALEEVALGRWHLRGFSDTGENGDPEAVVELLLGISQARLEQVQLQLQFLAGHAATVQSRTLQLARADDFRRLQGDLRLEAGQPPIELVVEASGDPRRLDDFRAHGHVQFRGVDLTPVLPLLEPLGIELRQGRVDGEFWLAWQGDRQFSAQGRMTIPELDLAGLSGRDLRPLTEVALQVRLQAGRDDWQLWIPSLQAQWAGQSLQAERLWVQRAGDGSLDLGLARLALEPLAAALSGSGLLREEHRQWLEELAPRGDLVRVRLHRPPGGEMQLRTELDNVGLDPWRGAPGADGVDGYLEAGLRQGRVVLASRDLQLRFPPVYEHALQVDEARAALRWQLDDERIHVHSGPIAASAGLGAVAGHLSLDLPVPGASEQPPEMTLVLGLQDSHSRYRQLLVPTLLHDGLLDWLETAIGPARIPSGGFIYRGSLRGDDDSARTVQLALEVRDGALDYQPPWPALRDIDARLLIDDGHTRVEAYQARALAQTLVTAAEVDFDPGTMRLRALASLRSADADLIDLITTTPLRQWVGETLDDWSWQGPVEAELDLAIPLSGELEPKVAVAAQLGPGRLDLGNLGLTVSELQGPLHYASASANASRAASPDRYPDAAAPMGLSSVGLTGKLFGQPLRGRLGQEDGQVWLELETPELSVANLQRWLQLPLPLEDIAEGGSPVRARIEIGGNGGLQASSDLRGIAIDLPEPWGKTAPQPMPLQLQMALPGGPLQLSVGDALRLAWQLGDDAGGALALGPADLPELMPGRIRIAGELQQVDLNSWQRTLQGIDMDLEPIHSGAAPGGDRMVIEMTDMRMAGLPLLGQSFSNIRIAGGNQNGDWRLHVHADQLNGELVLPAPSGAPLAIWLGRLDLSSGSGDAADNAGSLDPAAFPDLELEFAVGALRLDGELLGGLRFDLQPLPDGVRLTTLGGSLRGVSITGSPDQMGAQLDWRADGQGTLSEFRGRLLTGDLSGVLHAFGYERALTSARSVVDAQLSWPGGPGQLSLAGLNGEMALMIEDGRFVNVSEPTSGALKAMGIFNLANLTRRLRLDFSDIFKSGVSFNRLDAHLHFDRGLVETLSPLRVTSPSSRFQATGSVDFNTDLVQMELVATLPIASNLPWVAALAGGLPAAAGVFIVGKLFEEQMDRYSSVVYQIDGSWTDPRIEFVRVFDDLDTLESSTGTARQAVPVVPVQPDQEGR